MIKKLLLPLLIMLVLGAKAEVKPKYMWFDCEANYKRLSYPDSIAYYLNKVKKPVLRMWWWISNPLWVKCFTKVIMPPTWVNGKALRVPEIMICWAFL